MPHMHPLRLVGTDDPAQLAGFVVDGRQDGLCYILRSRQFDGEFRIEESHPLGYIGFVFRCHDGPCSPSKKDESAITWSNVSISSQILDKPCARCVDGLAQSNRVTYSGFMNEGWQNGRSRSETRTPL